MIHSDPDVVELRNGSRLYFSSKRLLSESIPYFSRMFANDNLETRSQRVTLSLDELGFENVMTFVKSGMYVLSMECVIGTYFCCDYLTMDQLKVECFKYFHEHFNIGHLPVVMKNIAKYKTNLIDRQTIDCLLCRHFLKIANTQAFLDFPIETVKQILKLNLAIDSEYQVFDAMRRWVEYRDEREEYLMDLMRIVRWSHIESSKLEIIKNETDELIRDETSWNDILNVSKRESTRVMDRSPLFIYYIDEVTIEIVKFVECKFYFMLGKYTLDPSISVGLLDRREMTDISYDSGRKLIRVYWQKRTFNYLKMCGSSDSYLSQLHKTIFFSLSQGIEEESCSLSDPVKMSRVATKSAIIDINGLLHSVGWDDDPESIYCSQMRHESWFNSCYELVPSYHVVAIKERVFIITKGLEMVILDTNGKSFRKVSSLKFDYCFDSLKFFSYCDQLLFYHQPTREMYVYNEETSRWSMKFRSEAKNELMAISTTYTGPKEN